MKYGLLITALALISCGGSLTDEQRNKIRDEMRSSRIKRVSDVELTEVAFRKSRAIYKHLGRYLEDSLKIDSLARAEAVSIQWVGVADTVSVHPLQREMMEAYIASPEESSDHVQKVRSNGSDSDSLLYTMPVLSPSADGSRKLTGVWNIWLSKKQLILSME